MIPRRSRRRSSARATTTSPSLIACRTLIGFGAPNRQGTEKAHGAPLGAEEIARPAQRWTGRTQPFEIPDDVLERLARDRRARARGAAAAWIERTQAASIREHARRSMMR